MEEAEDVNNNLEQSPVRQFRTRRRDFHSIAKKSTLKGRRLLLEDSDDEGNIIHRTGSEPTLATTNANTKSFQDIMSSIESSTGDSLRLKPTIRVSSVPEQISTGRRSRHSAFARTSSKELPHLPSPHSETEFRVPRRHSAAPSTSCGQSRRRSADSSLLHSTKHGSTASLIETEGLDKEDLELLRVLKRRQAILRELVTTESSFSDDLAVVVEEYQSRTNTCRQLTKDDVRQIFGGVEPVMAFSRDFATDLQNASYSVLFSEAVSMESLQYEDAQTGVGIVFGQSIGRLSRVFSRYCSTHETAAKCLQKVSKDPAVQKWLADRHPVDKTTAWDLPSLLIKPIQRIMKYPLLLTALLEATPNTHADYYAIDSALKEMLLVAENINNIKIRRDLVGSVTADRKKNDFTALAKTFSRRAPRVKQSAGIEEEVEYADVVYDRLVASFRAQEAVVATLRLEVQDWLLAMKSALEYHAKLALAFVEVQSCHETDPSSIPPAVDWTCYTRAINDLQLGAFVELTHNLEREVFHPLALMESNFARPKQVIEKHDRQAEVLQSNQINSSKGLTSDRSTAGSADEYAQLNYTITQELPIFLRSTKTMMDLITSRLAKVQSEWFRSWHMRIGSLLQKDSDPAQIEDHFHDRYEIMLVKVSEFSLLQGNVQYPPTTHISETGSRMTLSDDSSSNTSDVSPRVSGLASRPTMRIRALSAANSASLSLKQISPFGRVPSGPPTPNSGTTRMSYNGPL